MNKLRLVKFLAALYLILVPLSVGAQQLQLPDPPVPEIFKVEFSKISTVCTDNGSGDQDCVYQVPWLGEYIAEIYKYAVALSTVLAAVVIMVAGFMWTTAGGNNSQVEQARSYISGAVLGLILMLGSYVILYTINPKLVQFDALSLTSVKHISLQELSKVLGGFEGHCSVNTVNTSIHPAANESKTNLINSTAAKFGMDPFVVASFIARESTFNFCDGGVNSVCNNKEYDALGAMQVIPTTANDMWKNISVAQPSECRPTYEENSNVKPIGNNTVGYAYRPECKQFIAQNQQVQIELGTAYLAYLNNRLKSKGVNNNLALLAAAYFAGPGAADKLINDEDGSVIQDMPKTKQYSDALQSIYKDFCSKTNGEILIDAQPTPHPSPTT